MVDHSAKSLDAERDRLILQAKIARAQFLKRHPGSLLKMAGWIALSCLLTSAFFRPETLNRQKMWQQTMQMERLAKEVATARTIPDVTAIELSRLIDTEPYNCERRRCDHALDERNRAARAVLQALLDRYMPEQRSASRAGKQVDAADFR